MNKAIFTKRFFKCLACGNNDFTLEHLFEMDKKDGPAFGPWYCDQPECGVSHRGYWKNGELEITFNPLDQRLYTWVVLTAEKLEDVTILVRGMRFVEKGKTREGYDDRYYYEEHTCPINILRSTERIFLKGDDDVHGAFHYEGVLPDGCEAESADDLVRAAR